MRAHAELARASFAKLPAAEDPPVRLLPLLDFAAFARTPKIFLGFSDATFLLNAIVEKSANTPCERCWRALPEVEASDRHLCARCTKAVA